MYQNVGKLIGFYRKQKWENTKDSKYVQINFIKFDQCLICSQSKLSFIENGNIKNPYPEEYHSLITNLGFQSLDYFNVESNYEVFLSKLLYTIQYDNTESLNELVIEFENNLERYNSFFYLSNVNEIIKFTFNYLKSVSLPDMDNFDFYIKSIDCYSKDIQCLILNLAYLLVENYNPSHEARNQITTLILNTKINNPLIEILKATLYLRQRNFKIVNKILSLIDFDMLNNYLKFKIERLRFMMETENVDEIKHLLSIQNPSYRYFEINRFEYCRTFMHTATLLYSFKEFFLSFEQYQKAIRINPEVSCLSLIYLFDCLYESNQLNIFDGFYNLSKLYLDKYTQLHRDISEFCYTLSNNYSTSIYSELLNSLFANLSTLNRESPYIQIVRKHLMIHVTKTHKYKIIYDLEKCFFDSL